MDLRIRVPARGERARADAAADQDRRVVHPRVKQPAMHVQLAHRTAVPDHRLAIVAQELPAVDVAEERDVEGTLLVSYLVTLVLIPPVALIWGVAEKSRWGTGVILIGMWTVWIMSFRVLQVWHA